MQTSKKEIIDRHQLNDLSLSVVAHVNFDRFSHSHPLAHVDSRSVETDDANIRSDKLVTANTTRKRKTSPAIFTINYVKYRYILIHIFLLYILQWGALVIGMSTDSFFSFFFSYYFYFY